MTHVDPEMLAAWADDALSPDDARAVESHLADCSECREVAAVFGRTIETSEPAERRTALSGWILPLAASIVIAGGVAWKFWPRPAQPEQLAARTTAQTTEAAAPPIQTVPPAPAPPPQKESLPVAPPAKAPKTRVVQPAPTPVPPAAAPVAPPLPAPVASPPPPPPSTIVPMTPPQGPPVPAVQAGPPPLISDTMLRANVGAANAVRAAGGGGGRGGGAPRLALITSTAPLLWRISATNIVERSTNDGATWSTVPIAAEGVQITFGSAPNAGACWLVGRMGAVFLSKNGEAFKRLPFPEVVDLTTVIAIDDVRATVIARDGRAFSTADGGQTWQVARF